MCRGRGKMLCLLELNIYYIKIIYIYIYIECRVGKGGFALNPNLTLLALKTYPASICLIPEQVQNLAGSDWVEAGTCRSGYICYPYQMELSLPPITISGHFLVAGASISSSDTAIVIVVC